MSIYYVSPADVVRDDGYDKGDGSFEKPWATLAYAINKIVERRGKTPLKVDH